MFQLLPLDGFQFYKTSLHHNLQNFPKYQPGILNIHKYFVWKAKIGLFSNLVPSLYLLDVTSMISYHNTSGTPLNKYSILIFDIELLNWLKKNINSLTYHSWIYDNLMILAITWIITMHKTLLNINTVLSLACDPTESHMATDPLCSF